MAIEHSTTTWLTQDAYDKLVAELEYLKGEGRQKVTAKIAQARDEGDLSENGGYHAAREEQGQQEARIRQLTAMLENAEVGEAPTGSHVTPGTLVTVYFDGDEDDDDTFLLGSREVMGLDDSVGIEVYSPQSPLGAAIMGAAPGDTVSYTAPTGSRIDVTIVAVEPYSR